MSGPGAAPPAERAAGRAPRAPHLLTIVLEDYYHNFDDLIQRSHWNRFERRVEHSTRRTLELLDEFGIRATFFTLGWVAETLPELIREVADRGHEVASKGYSQRGVRQLTRSEFRVDLAQAREALERASGQRVVGYRAPGWLAPSELWALEVLAEEGYAYDSSVKPLFGAFRDARWRRVAHANQFGERTLWEFPISAIEVARQLIPIGAGNYFRQLPRPLVQRAVEHWARVHDAPFTMYFHTWELDPDQPHITAASRLDQIRRYRNLREVPSILGYYFDRYAFTRIVDHLGIGTTVALPPAVAPVEATAGVVPDRRTADGERWRGALVGAPAAVAAGAGSAPAPSPAPVTRVSLVVPCYNEERTLPYLANTLASVEASHAGECEFEFIFVDDRSADGTWEALERIFGAKHNCTLLRHERNGGVAVAILTGIRHARTEVVASIDCDCTYDPHEIGRMVALLTDGVDLVTGSPYHQQGQVRNVPSWRLGLSKSASALYRVVLRQKLHTYTSCFRVYRRSAVLAVQISSGGFLGVAEMIGKLDLAGSRIVEYPTTLNVRVLGRSKMRVLRTVAGHLGLLSRLAALRVVGRRRPGSPAYGPPAEEPRLGGVG